MDIRNWLKKKGGGGGEASKASPANKKQEEKVKEKEKKKAAEAPAAKPKDEKKKAAASSSSSDNGKSKSPAPDSKKRPQVINVDDDEDEEVVVKPKKRNVETETKVEGGSKADPVLIDMDVDDSEDQKPAASKKRAPAPRKSKEAAASAGKKRRKVVRKSDDESDDDEESDFDEPSEEEESEEEEEESEFDDEDDDEDFGGKKKKQQKGGKASGGGKKRAAKKAAPASPPKAKEVKSSAKKKTPTPPPRKEVSVEDYFGGGTRSKYFSVDDDGDDDAPSSKEVSKAVKEEASEVEQVEDQTKKPAAAPESAVKEERPAVSTSSPASATKGGGVGGGGKGFGGWKGGEHRGVALNPGSKEIPTGAPGCLDGKTFVFTGVLSSLDREVAEDFVKTYGGRVTNSVSGKTSYVVVGIKLEDGRAIEEGKKYRDAKEKKVKIIDEDGLLALIRDSAVKSSDEAAVTSSKPTQETTTVAAPGSAIKEEAVATSSPASAVKGGGGGGGGRAFGGWKGGEHRGVALNPGSKEIPTGAPGCLDGKTFVFTGVLSSLDREVAEDLVKTYGGRVTNSVSGKTSYVVMGIKLEDGRAIEEGKKYRDAKEKKVKIIDEDGLLALIRDSAGKSSDEAAVTSPKPTKNPPTPSSAAKGKMPAKISAAAAKKQASGAAATTHTINEADQLWADKYRPKIVEDLIGTDSTAKAITGWLQRWDAIHRTKTMKPPPFNPHSKENPGAKAVLLSGPPGIGKSTVAAVVARNLGYDILELNASDTRSKKSLQEELSDVLDNTVISIKRDHAVTDKKRIVIMDEVDGMSGSDRGGVAELIRLVKSSKVPIICICNDRQSTKVKGLANSCLDLRVKRPMKQQIAQRMIAIAQKEGLMIERNAIELLVESVGNDIRQVLNTMQMWKKTSPNMRYTDMKDRLSSIEKDKTLRLSGFDAAKMIVGEGASKPFSDRFNAYFVDYSLVPLLVEQNYIEGVKVHRNGGVQEQLQRLEAASEAVSDSDLVGKLIMQDQNWNLLPLQACMNVKVGYETKGAIGFPAFPAWFGKNSSQGKRRRLTQELLMHMTGRISGGFEAVRLHYVPALRQRILSYLQKGSEGVPEVIELLDAYGMSREDVMETMVELYLSPNGKDPLKELDSKVKSAFTREYNKGVHMSQGLAHSESFKVKGKKGGGGGGGATGAVDEEGLPIETEGGEAAEEEEEEEEEDDKDISKFVKKAGGRGSKGGGGTKGGGAAKGGGGGGKGKGKKR